MNGADGGTRSFDVVFPDGTILSLDNLSGSSWSAPAAPITFLAGFTAGNNNSVQFINANGPAPNVDHIVVSGAGGNGSGATVGTGSSSGGGIDLGSAPPDGGTLGDTTGFGAPQDLMDNLVNDYVPTGYCVFFGTSDCAYYFRDEVNRKNSGFYGLWGSGANPNYDQRLPIQNSEGHVCEAWLTCTFHPQYFQYSTTGANEVYPGQMNLTKLGVSDVSAKGITFLLRQYTFPHKKGDGSDITGDALTALGTDGVPIFSIREIGSRWGFHSFRGIPGQPPTTTGFDELFWEPYDYPTSVNAKYQDIYYTFSPDGRLTVDRFLPYYPFSGSGEINYLWEEAVADSGWPVRWNGDGSQTFTQIGGLVVGGANGNASSIDGFRQLKVFNTAFTSNQMIEMENSLNTSTPPPLLTAGMVPCNTGQWMNAGTVSTPCGQGGNQQPIPLPDTSLTGFTPLNQSYAPTSLSASDTNFTFTFSYTPPSAFPPISEVQDPSQPAQLSYPLNPLDYTLYLDTQDVNGLHECQANLSQVGTTQILGEMYFKQHLERITHCSHSMVLTP